MDTEDRFFVAIVKRADEKLHEDETIYFNLGELEQIARELDVPDTIGCHVLRQLDDNFLLTSENGHFYKGEVALALLYEDRFDRAQLWRRNGLRREMLRRAALAFEREEVELDYHEDGKRFLDVPYGEAVAAARALAHWNLIKLRLFLGKNFAVSIMPDGYDLGRDENELRHQLPISAAEDEQAHAAVASDALGELITSVEQLLQERGWEGALRELRRGDDQYEDRHWVDAVGGVLLGDRKRTQAPVRRGERQVRREDGFTRARARGGRRQT